jgi:hypothetical protein
MRYTDKFDSEYPDIDDIARPDAMNQGVTCQIMFFKFAFGEPGSEMRTVNRDVEAFEYVRQSAEMILMPVRKNYGSDVIAKLFEETKIWNANIYAISSLFGKSHSGVEDQHFIAVTYGHAVHPKLADAAEGDDL